MEDDPVNTALQRYLAAEQELEAARWALIEAANARTGLPRDQDEVSARPMTIAAEAGVLSGRGD